jgi:hypothetical protein
LNYREKLGVQGAGSRKSCKDPIVVRIRKRREHYYHIGFVMTSISFGHRKDMCSCGEGTGNQLPVTGIEVG